MQRIFTQFQLLTASALFVLLSLCFLPAQAHAQGEIEVMSYQLGPVGLAPGQGKRFTIFVPTPNPPVRAQVKLYDARGAVVAQSSEVVIAAGTFHSFDFHRNDIPLPGEPGTGRLQLRASCSVSAAGAWQKVDGLQVSVEVMEDGRSGLSFTAKPTPPSAAVKTISWSYDDESPREYSRGFAPGQTLRVSLFNPPAPTPEAQARPAGGHVKIFDSSGNLIAQSPNLIIPPGEFRTVDFNRAAFNLPGEPGTGRLQVRVVAGGTFTLTFNGQTTSAPLPASFEIIDNATGKTRAYDPATSTFFLRNTNSP